MTPKRLFAILQPAYHYTLALLGAIIYRFPSRSIFVVGVTGTKGKTTTIEVINAILEEAGYTTALSSTLRFKISNESTDNTYKMTMPGRFFVQKFLRMAVQKSCNYAIIEMTSEGAKQFRHRFIHINTLIFTNISPEHIESHGSYENYLEAKLSIARHLAHSKKTPRTIIANKDDPESPRFLHIDVDEKHTFSLADAKPYELKKNHTLLTINGQKISTNLSGTFNIYNILAAVSFARTQQVHAETIRRAIKKFAGVRGRMEHINVGQDFTVIVDYAHTADSLEKVYEVFQNAKKICVLGGTGGGRDTWKRPRMGAIASRHCSQIILTNEDPYDEDPGKIVAEIQSGITRPIVTLEMDRRKAIAQAFKMATTGDVVIITGKGTDPFIMEAGNKRTPWSDAQVAREELERIIAWNTAGKHV